MKLYGMTYLKLSLPLKKEVKNYFEPKKIAILELSNFTKISTSLHDGNTSSKK